MEANQNQKTELKKSTAQSTASQHSTNENSSMQSCIDLCLDCSTSCLQLIPYCLKQGEDYAEASHILLLQNCADICRTSANLMISNSPFANAICKLCADICKQCADECEQFAGDQKMEQCAKICRQCADSCLSMSKMT